MLARTLKFALLCTAVAAPMSATAKPKRPKRAKPACGLTYLPLAEGETWVYEYETPTEAPPERRGPKVNPPETVTVKVVSVKSEGPSATITLEESFRKVKLTTEHTCTAGGLDIDPQSFLWNGEPGGGLGQALEDLKRNGNSFPGKKGLKGDYSEEITATVTRTPAREDLGKPMKVALEVEREVKVAGRTKVILGEKQVTATRLDVTLKGRARVADKKNASTEMRTNTKALLWFASGKGLVRVTNPRGHSYVLKTEE